jgi:hypothetical protein
MQQWSMPVSFASSRWEIFRSKRAEISITAFCLYLSAGFISQIRWSGWVLGKTLGY